MPNTARVAGLALLIAAGLTPPSAMADDNLLLRGGATAALPLPDTRAASRLLTITVEAYEPAGGAGEIVVRSAGEEVGRIGIFPNEPFRAGAGRTMRFDLPLSPGTLPAGRRSVDVTFDAPPTASLALGPAMLR